MFVLAFDLLILQNSGMYDDKANYPQAIFIMRISET